MDVQESNIRTDYRTGYYSIIVPGRTHRPEELEVKDEASSNLEDCPFERDTVDQKNLEIMHVNEPWTTMVIRNKFPELSGSTPLEYEKGFFSSISGYGYNEVEIETPNHFEKFEEMDTKKSLEWLNTLIEREEDLYSRNYIKHVMVFKNSGAKGGASIGHSHTQIIAWPELLGTPALEIERAKKYENENNSCLYEDSLKKESERILFETEKITAIAPYGSRIAGESMLLPKRHVNYIMDLDEQEKEDLVEALKSIIRTNIKLFGKHSYNFVIHENRNEKDYHMHIELYPRLADFAGIELGQNVFVNTTVPEEYAKKFKEAKLSI
jgi:UDPglucose--hexose-1-phosphate uridylyltransferase